MTTITQGKEVNAYTQTPAGSTIRICGYEQDDGQWVEAVEIADGDYDDENAHVTTILEDVGMKPMQVYNRMILPFLDEDGNPIVEEEA